MADERRSNAGWIVGAAMACSITLTVGWYGPAAYAALMCLWFISRDKEVA